MVVSCCHVLQHLCLDLYNLAQDWSIYLPELAWLQAHWTFKEDQERLRTQIKERSVHSKYKTSGYSAWCKTTGSQVSCKQRADIYEDTHMFLRVLNAWLAPIPCSFRSKYYPQEETLQTNRDASKRDLSTRNWQDAQSRSSEASAIKPPTESTVLYLLMKRTSLAI